MPGVHRESLCGSPLFFIPLNCFIYYRNELFCLLLCAIGQHNVTGCTILRWRWYFILQSQQACLFLTLIFHQCCWETLLSWAHFVRIAFYCYQNDASAGPGSQNQGWPIRKWCFFLSILISRLLRGLYITCKSVVREVNVIYSLAKSLSQNK